MAGPLIGRFFNTFQGAPRGVLDPKSSVSLSATADFGHLLSDLTGGSVDPFTIVVPNVHIMAYPLPTSAGIDGFTGVGAVVSVANVKTKLLLNPGTIDSFSWEFHWDVVNESDTRVGYVCSILIVDTQQ
jgi:hypothetical protein